MSKALTLVKSLAMPKPRNDCAALMVASMPKIAEFLPDSLNGRAFCMAMVTEANKLSDNVSPESAVLAGLHAAVIGLIPGPALGHCYLVPFKGKCTLVPGYKGYLELAYGCNFLSDVHADVVLEGEQFRFWKDESGPRIQHDVALDRTLRRDKVLGAYCIYHTVSGGRGIHVVGRAEIDKVDTQKNVWASDYIPMCRKTPTRRAAKEWRMTRGMALAVMLDEQQERGEDQHSDDIDVTVLANAELSSAQIDLDQIPE